MISLLCKRAQSLLARVLREESGSAAVNVVFFLIGGICAHGRLWWTLRA